MPFDNINYESDLTRNLRKARDVIERGWCAGARDDTHGNHCAIGALEVVLALPAHLLAELDEVKQLAKFTKVAGKGYSPATLVALHNNTLGKEATLQMFDEAIADSVAPLLV